MVASFSYPRIRIPWLRVWQSDLQFAPELRVLQIMATNKAKDANITAIRKKISTTPRITFFLRRKTFEFSPQKKFPGVSHSVCTGIFTKFTS